MRKFLIADSELARAAGVTDKTVKNLLNSSRSTRIRTKRAVLEGLNEVLKERGEAPVSSDIFD